MNPHLVHFSYAELNRGKSGFTSESQMLLFVTPPRGLLFISKYDWKDAEETFYVTEHEVCIYIFTDLDRKDFDWTLKSSWSVC